MYCTGLWKRNDSNGDDKDKSQKKKKQKKKEKKRKMMPMEISESLAVSKEEAVDHFSNPLWVLNPS